MNNRRTFILVAVVFIALSAVLLARLGAKDAQTAGKTEESSLADEVFAPVEDPAMGWQVVETAQDSIAGENGNYGGATTPEPTTVSEVGSNSTTIALEASQTQAGAYINPPTATNQPGSTAVPGVTPTATTGSTLAPTSTPTPTQTLIPTEVFTPYDWTGQWTVFFGEDGGLLFRATLVVSREGNTITGIHSTQIFTGTLSADGMTVSGTWVNPPATGTFSWRIIDDNQFCGNMDVDLAYCAARRGASRPAPCFCLGPED